jgi:predicted Zn-dependent peptidase
LHFKTVFDNGLRLIASEMPHARSVSIVFFMGVGSCYENNSEGGMSHFIEHLCFKGTKKRKNAKEISEVIEGVGGLLNGGTDKELTVFWCKVASKHFDMALDLLVDMIQNSIFDAKEMDKERQVIIEEINMSMDSPSQRVDLLIDELLWPDLPLGRDIAGSRESVSAISHTQLLDYYSRHYLPNNTVISIAGGIDHSYVQDVLNQKLRDWKPGIASERFTSVLGEAKPGVKIETRKTEQVHLCIGVPGLSLSHMDRYSIDLLNVVLGEGMCSRLFMELRENRGLTYDIHSSSDHYIDSGAVVVSAGVDNQRMDSALGAILDQLAIIRQGITEAELQRAKELVKGRLLLALEDSRNVANWLGAQELLMGHILTVDEVTSRFEAVTLEDIRRVAQIHFVQSNLKFSAVGPIKRRDKDIIKLLKL